MFFTEYIFLKKSNEDSASAIVKAFKPCWEKTRIPMNRDDHVTEKILRYYAKWKLVCRGCQRNISSHTEKEE